MASGSGSRQRQDSRTDPSTERSLDQIAPEEIANAMTFVRRDQAGIDDDRTIRRTAELFGVARLGYMSVSGLSVFCGPCLQTNRLRRRRAPANHPRSARGGLCGGRRRNHIGASHAASRSAAQKPPPSLSPMIATLVAEADGLRPDLQRVDEFAYYDYRLGRSLPAVLRELVNEIVLILRSTVGQARTSSRRRRRTFRATSPSPWAGRQPGSGRRQPATISIGSSAESQNNSPTTRLSTRCRGATSIRDFVAQRLSGARPALIGSVESQLRQHAEAAGLIEKVEQEVKQEARNRP